MYNVILLYDELWNIKVLCFQISIRDVISKLRWFFKCFWSQKWVRLLDIIDETCSWKMQGRCGQENLCTVDLHKSSCFLNQRRNLSFWYFCFVVHLIVKFHISDFPLFFFYLTATNIYINLHSFFIWCNVVLSIWRKMVKINL